MSKPTTVDAVWLGDSLGRQADADLLIHFLTKRIEERGAGAGAYVINLNTGWGTGKTYFLKRLEQQLALTGFLVSYVDAWRDDDAGEPLVAVMSAIDQTLKPFLKGKKALEKAWDTALAAGGQAAALALKGAAYQGAKRLLGPAVEAIGKLSDTLEISEAESAIVDGAADGVEKLATKFLRERLDAYRSHRESTDAFKTRVDKLLSGLRDTGGKKLPYFILIDELDRCRPSYAVEMLEQVKHLFDINNVCFVLATDGVQLAHAVRAVYGPTFDGDTYLRRFFNRSYRFGDPSRKAYVSHLVNSASIDEQQFSPLPNMNFGETIATCAAAYGLSLRDIDQIFDQVRSVGSIWNRHAKIELAYLLPLIISHHLGNTSDWQELQNGNPRSIPKEWSAKTDQFDQYRNTSTKVIVSVDRILNQLSTALESIDDVIFKQHTDVQSWFRERMMDEIGQENQGRVVQSNEKRASLLSNYPQMVINLAKLAEPAT